jgi:glycosyltransferase involved in cell wall biosynthesis
MNPEEYFASLGIFVMPSLWEPFGLALVEAMAYGRPCIASRVQGMQEIIQHESNGLLVPPNNHVALAHAIQRLLDDAELSRRIGRNARQRVQAFNIKRTVEEIQSIYLSLSS